MWASEGAGAGGSAVGARGRNRAPRLALGGVAVAGGAEHDAGQAGAVGRHLEIVWVGRQRHSAAAGGCRRGDGFCNPNPIQPNPIQQLNPTNPMQPNPIQPNPTQPHQIKPHQPKSNQVRPKPTCAPMRPNPFQPKPKSTQSKQNRTQSRPTCAPMSPMTRSRRSTVVTISGRSRPSLRRICGARRGGGEGGGAGVLGIYAGATQKNPTGKQYQETQTFRGTIKKRT